MTTDSYDDESLGQKSFDVLLRFYPIPKDERCDQAVCRRLAFIYGIVVHHSAVNSETHVNLHELFGMANLEMLQQLAAMAGAERLVAADGSDAYLPHLDRLELPITFLHGAHNLVWVPESTKRTYDVLVGQFGPQQYERIVFPDHGHQDTFMGERAVDDAFPAMLEHLEQRGSLTGERPQDGSPASTASARSTIPWPPSSSAARFAFSASVRARAQLSGVPRTGQHSGPVGARVGLEEGRTETPGELFGTREPRIGVVAEHRARTAEQASDRAADVDPVGCRLRAEGLEQLEQHAGRVEVLEVGRRVGKQHQRDEPLAVERDRREAVGGGGIQQRLCILSSADVAIRERGPRRARAHEEGNELRIPACGALEGLDDLGAPALRGAQEEDLGGVHLEGVGLAAVDAHLERLARDLLALVELTREEGAGCTRCNVVSHRGTRAPARRRGEPRARARRRHPRRRTLRCRSAFVARTPTRRPCGCRACWTTPRSPRSRRGAAGAFLGHSNGVEA